MLESRMELLNLLGSHDIRVSDDNPSHQKRPLIKRIRTKDQR